MGSTQADSGVSVGVRTRGRPRELGQGRWVSAQGPALPSISTPLPSRSHRPPDRHQQRLQLALCGGREEFLREQEKRVLLHQPEQRQRGPRPAAGRRHLVAACCSRPSGAGPSCRIQEDPAVPHARQRCPGPGSLLTHLAPSQTLREPHSGRVMPPALPSAPRLPGGLLPSSHCPAGWAS